MSHAGRRKWRLFSFALLCGFGVGPAHAQTVTLTTVSDIGTGPTATQPRVRS